MNPLKAFVAWRVRRSDRAAAKAHADGYAWAAGELLSGRLAWEDVAAHTEAAKHYGDYDGFDYGADLAAFDWMLLQDGAK